MSETKQRKVKQIDMREHTKKKSMWAGSKSMQSIETYILNNKGTPFFELKTVKYPPALLKIIDEIVTNAIDHHVEYPKHVTKICINITPEGEISVYNNGPGIIVEKTQNIHGKEMYSPQLIFSEFLAGSNLEDNDDRIVGGTNGVGAKVTGVFSTMFRVETTDSSHKIHYRQEYTDGLQTIHEPVLTPLSSKELTAEQKKDYTKITFMPDYAEFKINGAKFYPTLKKLIEARAWQASAYVAKTTKVYFNDEFIPVTSFENFCAMFSEFEIFPTEMNNPDSKYQWSVCIGLTDGKERHISIVNGVLVPSGGTHIKYIQTQLVEALKDKVEKEIKKSGTKFNKNLLLNNLFVFMKGAIPSPEFLSQTKDAISTPIEKYKGYAFPASHINRIWELVKPAVLATFLKKQLGDVKLRANRGKIEVAKYREANYARDAKHCHECGLIITEGDSASGTANTGLLANASPNFNYDYFGVYGIQGVMINGLKESIEFGKKTDKKKSKNKLNLIPKKSPSVHSTRSSDNSELYTNNVDSDIEIKENTVLNATMPNITIQDTTIPNLASSIVTSSAKRIPNQKVLDNERISSLIKVLGLDYNKTYSLTDQGEKEWNTLRYGYICALTDQDLDGFNIFGLLVTFFITYWPALISRGFIRRIYTPLLRAYPKNKKMLVKEFYTDKEAKAWVAEQGEAKVKQQYTFKYYKGLASHVEARKEVTQMFKNINSKICTYVLDVYAIQNMYIYYGDNTAPRKIALSTPVVTDNLVEGLRVPLSQQYEVDTKSFQRDNIVRKLLNNIDGFVASRRKVFYTARKIGHDEIKVAGLASETVRRANYHHGEVSLEQTIVRMAQAYPGARNLPLLLPLGNFGSREAGYKNYGASRYIYTTINHRLSDKLFRKEDEFVLDYEVEDGERFEPKYYAPIIPYVLCETNELPATGWAISVHARNIDEIFQNTRAMIANPLLKCKPLSPWLKDFSGTIRKYKNRDYYVGNYEFDDVQNTIQITELPYGIYSDIYLRGSDEGPKKQAKRVADGVKRGIKAKEWVDDYEDNTTMDRVNIVLYLKPGAYDAINKAYGNETFDCFEDYLELKEPIYHRINLIDQAGKVVEYATYNEVFDDWFQYRKYLYGIRIERESILNSLEIKMLLNMQRFSQNHDSYAITNKSTIAQAVTILTDNKYEIFNKSILDSPKFAEVKELIELITGAQHGANYDYLLNMTYKDLTDEAYKKRVEQIEKLKKRQLYLQEDDIKKSFRGAKMWLHELDELEISIQKGLSSQWFYGTNEVHYEDNKKTKQKK